MRYLKFLAILLSTAVAQILVEYLIFNSIYEFHTYSTMRWVFQIIYWILSLYISVAVFKSRKTKENEQDLTGTH